MDKYELINKIRKLDGLTTEEKSCLLELLRKQKRYGLVWEDKPEKVEEDLKTKVPVLKEVKERAIINDTNTEHYPNHVLIEGDNLHAEVVLDYVMPGTIDVICIDPPYNTGNKLIGAFYYNDDFVDKENPYKHTKWLCFMEKRLKIAKKLLSDGGKIIISIDDNEVCNLKLLCDQIFGESNQIGLLPTIMNLKGNQDQFGFAGTHEYTLVYTNNLSKCHMGQLDVDDEELEDWLEDEIGYYKKGATLKRTGQDAPRVRRPWGYFPILVNRENLTCNVISQEEYNNIYDPTSKTFNDDYVSSLVFKYNALGYSCILPTANGEKTSWRWGFNTVRDNLSEIIVIKGNDNNFSLYKKQRPVLGDIPSKKPKSVLYKAQYSSGNGTAQLKKFGLEKRFNNPKPVELIKDLLKICTDKNSKVLDFFAGSGTTLQATMELNVSDKGKRVCYLVNKVEEDNICDVAYKRNEMVIKGYTTPDGDSIEGLHGNNLRYYKTEFVEREHTMKNMRALVAAATDMLCIKEDMYQEIPEFGPWNKLPNFVARHFTDGKGGEMLIIYSEDHIEEIVDAIYNMDLKQKLKVYVFSPDRDPYTDEFEDVEEKVELCALPAAIYDAYREVTPRPDDKEIEIAPVTEDNEEEPWDINEKEEDIQ